LARSRLTISVAVIKQISDSDMLSPFEEFVGLP
jgi:hypothetical protein